MHEKLAIHGGSPAVARPLNPYRGAAFIGEEEKAAVVAVLESKSLYRYYGPNLLYKVAAFESAFAAHLGARFVLACSSGTAALRLALIGMGIQPGDEIILPAATFVASAGAVVAQGAVPVFAEIDDSLTIDPMDVERRITARTRAIMPVHLFGIAADMPRLREIAQRRGLEIVEDAAQACGVSLAGRRLGTYGAAGAFSFQLEKHITSGEGGAVATDREDVFENACRYHDQGGHVVVQRGGVREIVPGAPVFGENLRMGEIAGAILECQLRRLESIHRRTSEARAHVRSACASLGLQWLADDQERAGCATGLWFLARDAGSAREMAKALYFEGVHANLIYDGQPVYMLEQVRARRAVARSCPFECAAHPTHVSYEPGCCPRSEDLLSRAVGVQVGPAYSERDVAGVATALIKVARAFSS